MEVAYLHTQLCRIHTHTQTLTQTHIDISVEAELLFMKYDKVYCSALLLLTIILIILVPLTPNQSLLTFSDFTQFTLIMYYYTSSFIDDHNYHSQYSSTVWNAILFASVGSTVKLRVRGLSQNLKRQKLSKQQHAGRTSNYGNRTQNMIQESVFMATEHQTQGQDNDSYTYNASISVWRATPRVSPRHSRNSAEKRSSMDLRFCSVCVWERVCVLQ